MKFAYLFAIAVRAQDGGDGTPHDPEAMAFCQGKFTPIGKFPGHELDQYSDEFQEIGQTDARCFTEISGKFLDEFSRIR